MVEYYKKKCKSNNNKIRYYYYKQYTNGKKKIISQTEYNKKNNKKIFTSQTEYNKKKNKKKNIILKGGEEQKITEIHLGYDNIGPYVNKAINPDIMKENLKLLCTFLNKNNIDYYVDMGSLLGIIRDKKLIASDTDADITLNNYELIDVQKLVNKLHNESIFKVIRYIPSIISVLKDNMYIDIYTCKSNLKTQLHNWDNYNFKIPSYPEKYLEKNYGDWKTPSSTHGSPCKIKLQQDYV